QTTECRVVFNEITKDAIKESFKHPRKIDMDLVDAQQARRILDRLVGYSISPILWKKGKKGLSAGRVQSGALRLIIDWENEIKNFEHEEYWSITGEFEKAKKKFEAQYYGSATEKMKLQNEEDVKAVMASMKDKKFTVNRVVKKERKRNPSPSFTTSSLQQEAARKLNFRAKKTMMLAQQLYEGIAVGKEGITGLITYMRTDSTRISETAKKDALDFITSNYGDDYVTKTTAAKQSAKSQDAHEAVRPTSVMRTPESLKSILSRDLYRLYKLIWDRFVASQMSPAILDTVMAELQNGEAVFRANGSQVKFPGFMKLYIEG